MGNNPIKNYYNRYHDSKSTTFSLKIKSKRNDSSHYSQVLDLIRAAKGKMILDVGCGRGEFLALAAKRELICHGIDISERALKEAKNESKAHYFCADIELGLPYSDEYFDYVTCLGVWEHFKNQEYVLAEIIRVLKKTGYLCIFVPNKNYILHKCGYETDFQPVINRYSLDGYIKKFKQAGLCIHEIVKNNSHLSNLNESSGYIKHFVKLLIHPFLMVLPIRLSYHFMFICSKKKT